MIAALPLSLAALLLASVSAVTNEELGKYAKQVVEIINKDKDSGPFLYMPLQYSDVNESGNQVTLTVCAVQTDCRKGQENTDANSCSYTENSKVLQHTATVTRRNGNNFTVSTTGAMEPDSSETVKTLGLETPITYK
uniref:Cystatin domain-containing protein n=1 Tax=Trichuris muris TaxID=70415 RepID=A0A5S6QKF9_TRIMR